MCISTYILVITTRIRTKSSRCNCLDLDTGRRNWCPDPDNCVAPVDACPPDLDPDTCCCVYCIVYVSGRTNALHQPTHDLRI